MTKILSITEENIGVLPELVATQGLVWFLVPREMSSPFFRTIPTTLSISGLPARLVGAASDHNFELWFHPWGDRDMLMCVGGKVGQRFEFIQQDVAEVDARLDDITSTGWCFDYAVHPSDFIIRSLAGHPRLLRGPTRELVMKLRRRGLRVRVIRNGWGSDCVFAYKRIFLIDKFLGWARFPIDFITGVYSSTD